MAIKKRLFRQKPLFDKEAVYTYLDQNDSDQYIDSNGIPVEYDKFLDKDLYTTSIGHPINEAILESELQSRWSAWPWSLTGDEESDSVQTQLDPLRYLGENFIQINKLVIRNRGVRSRINDVFFRIFIFSEAFFNPYDSNGNLRGFSTLKNGMQGKGDQDDDYDTGTAWFYSQTGPNYGERKSPGSLPGVENLKIVEDFYSPQGSTAIGANSSDFTHKRSTFNPEKSMLKVEGIGEDDITTIFQEDGAVNPIYIGIHMDGDQNPKHGSDRSRNNTVSIYKIDPTTLFDENRNGKVTTVEFENHTSERFSSGKRTAAFTAKELSLTISTIGGVSVGENYNPPAEYENLLQQISPPLPFSSTGDIDHVILNMSPAMEINDSINGYDVGGVFTDEIDLNILQKDMMRSHQLEDYYTSRFADFIPVTDIKLSTKDVQAYYENLSDRSYASAPGSIDLDFYPAINPNPYQDLCPMEKIVDGTIEGESVYCWLGQENWNFNSDTGNLQFDDIGELLVHKEYDHQANHMKIWKYTNLTHPYPHYTNDQWVDIYKDSGYVFFVVDWNDRDNKYETIDDVLEDWPRSSIDLRKKRIDNLFIPNPMGQPLSNGYTSPGIKTIKFIVFNYRKQEGQPNIIPNNIEPLRWKLVTARIFLDIPLTEFPDFGEVGGAEFSTLPWPYTTPIINGMSNDSKYMKSIDNILGGGKIGDQDIIDETFLLDSRENDEIGKNIEKLDVEQVRYFDKSYDMNKLLNIPTTWDMVTNTEPAHLATLPFPYFRQEFDAAGSLDENGNPQPSGNVNISDFQFWIEKGRPDIAHWIKAGLQDDISILYDSYYTFPIEDFIWPPVEHPIGFDEMGNLMGGSGPGGFECFVGGTKVKMGDGSEKNIEDIIAGEEVLSFNIHTKQIEPKKVTELFTQVHDLVDGDITAKTKFDNGVETHNTIANPFWSKDKGFVAADAERCNRLHSWVKETNNGKDTELLEVGDILFYYDDNKLKETKVIEIEDVLQPYIRTYDISVEDNHTFFANGILTHNSQGPSQHGSSGWATPFEIYIPGSMGGGGSGGGGNQPEDEDFEWTDEMTIQSWIAYFEATLGYDWNDGVGPNGEDLVWILTQAVENNAPYYTIFNWATLFYGLTPLSEDPDFVGSTTITNGCQLPPKTIFLLENGELLYNTGGGSFNLIQGFQFKFDSDFIINNISIEGTEASNVSMNPGGSVEPFTISYAEDEVVLDTGENVVLGFSLTGSFILNSCGTLLRMDLSPRYSEDAGWSNSWHIESNQWDGNEIYGIVFSNPQTEDIGMYYHTPVPGCTDPNANNFDISHQVENGSCEYPPITNLVDFENVEISDVSLLPNLYTDISGSSTQTNGYWNGGGEGGKGSDPSTTFSEESSVGQIFISDNMDLDLVHSCQLEINTGNLTGKSIDDSSGNLNKGLLIGDYKIKKVRKNRPMRRDSFIKVPKKDNKDGAL